MTGMVKEEILARQAELGFSVVKGCIAFDFLLFDRNELIEMPSIFKFQDTCGEQERIELPAGSLAYTICQVPVIYRASTDAAVMVYMNNGQVQKIAGTILDLANSRHIFERDGAVHHLVVFVSDKHN